MDHFVLSTYDPAPMSLAGLYGNLRQRFRSGMTLRNTQIKDLMLMCLTVFSVVCYYLYYTTSSMSRSRVGADGTVRVSLPRRQLNSTWLQDGLPSIPDTCGPDDRKLFVKSQCRSTKWAYEEKTNPKPPRLWVNDQHQLIYCLVGKTGSTGFRAMMAKLVSNDTADDVVDTDDGLRKLESLSPADLQRVTHTYKSLMVVRHPLDRLRSLYFHKLANPGPMNALILKQHIPTILKVTNHTSFNPWKDTLSFTEFLHLVGTEYRNGFVDFHWQSIEEKCKPCTIFYDYIIRVETLHYDIVHFKDYISRYGDLEHIVAVPDESINQFYGSHSNLTSTYREVPARVIKEVIKVYHKDMLLFGYDMSHDRMPSCAITRAKNRTATCC